MRVIGLRRVVQLGLGCYEVETWDGDRVNLSYDGVRLLAINRNCEELSFSIEGRGLKGELSELLDLGSFALEEGCLVSTF
jgi:hypothetical protein